MTAKKVSKVSPLTNRLAAYIAQTPRRVLPMAVTEATKHHVLDTLAAMVSGSMLLPGKSAISYLRTLGGLRECTVVGTRIVTNAINAALANGMLAHADETDDSHAASLTHPGCAVVASALAMGEREHCDGTAFLRAVALGYDVACRMGRALGGEPFRRIGHSTHSMAPAFGAAAAGAVLARLNPEQVRHVLSYAAQQASGLSCYTSDTDHIEKAFDFGGMPARNGVTAATMVASGCTGVNDVLSGERTFFRAFDESQRIGQAPAPEALVHALGRTYEVMNTNIKRWSVGSPIQAPLDSLLELIRANDLKPDQVHEVTIRVSHLAANTSSNREMPNICMEYLCAVMLIDGIPTFDSAHDVRRMKDRKVMALRKRIKVKGDDELQRLRVEFGQRHGIVEITLNDGRKLSHHTKAVRGTTDNPMTRPEVDEKGYHLMAPVLGKKRARALCDSIWNLERVRDLRTLRPLLQA